MKKVTKKENVKKFTFTAMFQDGKFMCKSTDINNFELYEITAIISALELEKQDLLMYFLNKKN